MLRVKHEIFLLWHNTLTTLKLELLLVFTLFQSIWMYNKVVIVCLLMTWLIIIKGTLHLSKFKHRNLQGMPVYAHWIKPSVLCNAFLFLLWSLMLYTSYILATYAFSSSWHRRAITTWAPVINYNNSIHLLRCSLQLCQIIPDSYIHSWSSEYKCTNSPTNKQTSACTLSLKEANNIHV